MRSLRGAALAALLVLGAGLRLLGIDWGLPTPAHHDYSYHPDEAPALVWARDLARGQLRVKQFQFGGTLHFSMLSAYFHLARTLPPHGLNLMADTLRVGRRFVVALALLTLLVVYQTGRLLFDERTGFLAAAFLAVAPAHVVLAQNVRADIAGTLLVALLLYLAACILKRGPRLDRGHFAAAGVVLGLMLALRAPLAAFGFAPFLAWVLRERPASAAVTLRRLVLPALLLGVAAVVAYALGSPQSLMHPDVLLEGLGVTMAYETGSFPDAIGRGPGLYQYGVLMLVGALGAPLYALAVAGVGAGATRPESRLLLLSAAPYFLLMTTASWVVVRYTLPLLPVLAVVAAAVVAALLRTRAVARTMAALLVAGACAWTVLGDIAFGLATAGANTRDQASAWLAALPPGSSVATLEQDEDDVFFNPVVPRGVAHTIVRFDAIAGSTCFGTPACDRVVLGEQVWRSMDRLGAAHPDPAVRALAEVLSRHGYRVEHEVAPSLDLLGIDFAPFYGAPDYALVNPVLRVYRR